jgi:hypothetical protein
MRAAWRRHGKASIRLVLRRTLASRSRLDFAALQILAQGGSEPLLAFFVLFGHPNYLAVCTAG